MVLNEKIRVLREMKQWTQEQMAEKMKMSKSGYAKIEQGKSKVNTERLAQLAEIFDVDVPELLSMGLNGTFNLLNENSSQSNYYGVNDQLLAEIDKLNLIIEHQKEIISQKDAMLRQKDSENALLKQIIEKLG